jgi:hypothetical protein
MNDLKQNINLKIQNNTAFPQDINIFGNISTIDSANNTNIIYNYDLSAETWGGGINQVRLQYTIPPSSVSNIKIVPLTDLSISGVVNALNSLGLDLFYFSGTNILVNSNTKIYLKLYIEP